MPELVLRVHSELAKPLTHFWLGAAWPSRSTAAF